MGRPDWQSNIALATEPGMRLTAFEMNETVLGPDIGGPAVTETFEIVPPAGAVAEIVLPMLMAMLSSGSTAGTDVNVSIGFDVGLPVAIPAVEMLFGEDGTVAYSSGTLIVTAPNTAGPATGAEWRGQLHGLRFDANNLLVVEVNHDLQKAGGGVPLGMQLVFLCNLREVA